MSKVFDFPGSTTTEVTLPTYTLSYREATAEGYGGVKVRTFKGDAVMTAAFVGFVDSEQVLTFAVPLESLISLEIVEENKSNLVS